jgi:hypothetical protein
MKDLETKQKVLDEIMALMDDMDGEKLKKHPKIMAAKIEIKQKPKLKIEGEKPELEDEEEMDEDLLEELLKQLRGE